MAACSNSIVLPDRRRFDVFAMRPVMALAMAAGCLAHAARVALFGERPSAPSRLAALMARHAHFTEMLNKMSEATDDMPYAEAMHYTQERIDPLDTRIDKLDAELLHIPPADFAEAVLKVRHLVILHGRYNGVLPENVMQAFLASFEGKGAEQ